MVPRFTQLQVIDLAQMAVHRREETGAVQNKQIQAKDKGNLKIRKEIRSVHGISVSKVPDKTNEKWEHCGS